MPERITPARYFYRWGGTKELLLIYPFLQTPTEGSDRFTSLVYAMLYNLRNLYSRVTTQNLPLDFLPDNLLDPYQMEVNFNKDVDSAESGLTSEVFKYAMRIGVPLSNGHNRQIREYEEISFGEHVQDGDIQRWKVNGIEESRNKLRAILAEGYCVGEIPIFAPVTEIPPGHTIYGIQNPNGEMDTYASTHCVVILELLRDGTDRVIYQDSLGPLQLSHFGRGLMACDLAVLIRAHTFQMDIPNDLLP